MKIETATTTTTGQNFITITTWLNDAPVWGVAVQDGQIGDVVCYSPDTPHDLLKLSASVTAMTISQDAAPYMTPRHMWRNHMQEFALFTDLKTLDQILTDCAPRHTRTT